ncbi:hypothetical protein A4R26_18835 [Niastella populi]|uniref:Uncharacterized protein n=1 Tax=Niastella populi TaxID=550983 RepID=A0A1V9FTB6_9BACT|nr:hypothetical protein A4R26_18835 [Niastella populi]
MLRGDKQKSPPGCREGHSILIVYDYPLLSGNGFVSPFPIKTIQVLAITALMTALAFIPVLYVVDVIMILNARNNFDAKLYKYFKTTNPRSKKGGDLFSPDTRSYLYMI